MASTTPRRRRKAADPAPPPALPLTAADLAEFMGATGAEDLGREKEALGHAQSLVAQAAGHDLPEQLPHALRQALLLTAARILITGDPTAAAIPLTARYYLATHAPDRAV